MIPDKFYRIMCDNIDYYIFVFMISFMFSECNVLLSMGMNKMNTTEVLGIFFKLKL